MDDIQLFAQELSRYNAVIHMLHRMSRNLPKKQRYELNNIVERWLINLSNRFDTIFNATGLETTYSATKKLLAEMNEKDIHNNTQRYKAGIVYINDFLSTKQHNSATVTIDNDTVQVFTHNKQIYKQTLPNGRVNALLQLNPSHMLLCAMIMRYASILSRGQQWSVPNSIFDYLYTRYNITIEGFASPINSKILSRGKFCSLFADTDSIYGSIGDFFLYDTFRNDNVFCNPPFVPRILSRMSKHITKLCDNIITTNTTMNDTDTSIRFFIIVPEWRDAKWYKMLETSKHKQYETSFNRNEHYYIDGTKKIIANFNTHLFILSVNVDDDDYDSIKW